MSDLFVVGNCYTAVYEKENKTFRAASMAEAREHAQVIGYGEIPSKVRLATLGECEGAAEKYQRDVAGTCR